MGLGQQSLDIRLLQLLHQGAEIVDVGLHGLPALILRGGGGSNGDASVPHHPCGAKVRGVPCESPRVDEVESLDLEAPQLLVETLELF